ncbi:unnamed protein product [Hymenolepis diminuta]|uniref:Transcription factor TFIIIC triple barrel domain-containing protein n=1 Tax=Hymenolepis diminuta TaxID=6216 RepID=A0A564Y7Q8_HYMDI|nr:unnamed protein product [Hymenolepis diminuta]
MVLSNEWEKDFGRISAALEETTPQLSMIQPNKFEKIPLNSSLSCQQQESSHPSLCLVPVKESTKQISVMPQSTSMIPRSVSKIPEALHISMNEQYSSLETWFGTPTFLDFSILSGVTIDPKGVVSTLKSAPIITQAQAQLIVAKTTQFEASSAFSFMTLLREGIPRKSVSLNEPNTSSAIESSISGHLANSGTSNQQWSTTISMTRSSPQMDTLSERRQETNSQPASSPQEGPTTTPPVQILNDTEMTEQSNQVSNSNNEDVDDNDEWEVLNEALVYADCIGAVESDLMEPGKSVLLVDLDSDNPLIQIGPAIFQGTYEDCLGTNLIFEKHSPNSEDTDASSSSCAQPKPSIEIFASRAKTSTRPTFSYFGKTAKNLNLNRVFLKPKE